MDNPYAPPGEESAPEPAAPAPERASVRQRIASIAIDAAIALVCVWPIYLADKRFTLGLGPPAGALAVLPIWIIRWLGGQSPGDRVCGIKQVRIDGKRRWIVVR